MSLTPSRIALTCEFISVSSYWLSIERFELYEAQHFGIEAQGLLLVVDVHSGQFDLHRFPPIITFAGARAADPESRAGSDRRVRPAQVSVRRPSYVTIW